MHGQTKIKKNNISFDNNPTLARC